MFERFTERARQVVVFAQEEARMLSHNYIGTEHLLLGLLREEEGLAAKVLESLEISVEEVRAKVAAIVGQGDEMTAGQIPFTPRAKKVLELALREGLSLGHDHIGTEHILLGLVRENEGVAARILLDLGADAEKIRDEIIGRLGGAEAPVGRSRRRRGRWRPSPGLELEIAEPGWEYIVVEVDALDEARLNELGAEAWELVAVVGTAPYRLVLKRRASAA